MKTTIIRYFIALLTMVAILLVSTACMPKPGGTTITSSQTITLSTPTPTPTPISTLVLPAEKLKQWEDRGFYNADTLEEASQVAGFKVATPAVIPEGFTVSNTWRVTRLGAGLPENLRPKFTQINVDQDWAMDRTTPSSMRTNMFALSQSTRQFGIGDDSEAVVIAGKTGQRILTPAEGDQPAKLTLGWSDGTRWYSLNGTLNEHLDEATLMKIAESVGVH